jgi:membrane protein YqaA with SNARE-associated domain
MHALTSWIVGLVASPAGILLLGALDSTIFNWFPLGIDSAVILVSARGGRLAWIAPLLATAGSVGGAALTFWMGATLGEKGLERYVSRRRLDRIRKRVRRAGAIALAVLDLLPPPFPFTPFVLVAGALGVKRSAFFITLTICRLARFGVEALLAGIYGGRLLVWLDSDVLRDFIAVAIMLAVTASVVSIVRLMRTRLTARRATA